MILPRYLGRAGFCVLLTLTAPVWAAEKKAAKGVSLDHQHEELGVNQFTTPSIETLLTALRELRPVPYDKVSRVMPEGNPSDRARLALSTGGIIADGFLAVAAEKGSRMEPIGRALLQHAKGLGVGEHVNRHSKGILERAASRDWSGVRAELIGAQRDVEDGMMALKDEEIAHLVALGGWWRGLEITAGIVEQEYTPQRAALLVQPGVLDYFIDRVSTLNPRLKKTKLWAALDENLRAARDLTVKDDHSPPTAEAVKKLRNLAKATNEVIAQQE
jgi:hypothetical protein